MNSDLEILRMARSLAGHAAARHGVVAKNVAHADTPGYRALDLPPFSKLYDAGVGAGLAAMRTTRPGHVTSAPDVFAPRSFETADQEEPNGNNVSLEAEMVRGAEAQGQHSLALAVYGKTMDILRAGLGR